MLHSKNEKADHEKGMVGSRGDDSDFDPVLWLPSSVSVKDVDVFSCIQVVYGPLSVDLEGVLAGVVVSCVQIIALSRLTPF